MSTLDLVIGPERAAAHIRRRADLLVLLDQVAPDTALRLVCEQVVDGDPIALAAPGQRWALRPGVDPDDAPALELLVIERLACPPRVLAEDEIGFREEIPLANLSDLFELIRWED